MGRLIDYNDVYNAIQITTDNFGVAKSVVEANILTMLSKIDTVEAIPKADYENRLKADMVAMLEDIDLKIDEMYEPQFSKEGMDGFYWAQGLFKDLVQEKINALKEKNNG